MNITKVISAMTEYFSGDPKRVGHFLKVYAFSKTIGEAEKLSAENQEILEIAAAVHDIGIKKSEELRENIKKCLVLTRLKSYLTSLALMKK